MATTKDITMKQFNGTDYDTLYPKTDVKQVENLTPSSIGAVAKTGDTMTGNLTIKNPGYSVLSLRSDGDAKGGDIEGGPNSINLVQFTEKDGSEFRQFSLRGIDRQPNAKIALEYVVTGEGESATYKVLHTGNAQSLGFSKIAAGSYVGTGTYGPSNPCSITFSFKPKIVIFPNNTVYNARGKSMIAVDCLTTSYQDVDGTLGYEVHAKFDTITNTLYWYSYSSDFHQLNGAGDTYYWVAIG